MNKSLSEHAALPRKVKKSVRSLGLGFKKSLLDSQLHERLRNHLSANVHNFHSVAEDKYLQTENSRSNPSLFYYDEEFNQKVLAELQPAHEEWSGVKLVPAVCYGVRVYQRGSYLINHTDVAQTHVVSGTICIDCELQQPWPLYIEDLDGNPHEVDVEPGEIVFFEGALLRHGRPQPMYGDYYASMFVHYTPIDWKVSGQN